MSQLPWTGRNPTLCTTHCNTGYTPASNLGNDVLVPKESSREATTMIERSQHEGILTLRLAHGKASAIDIELLDALLRELDGVAEDVRALILTGTGSIFSAGVDLFRLTLEGADYVRRFLPLLSRFVRTLFTFPRPVVAAANGHAIAGGCVTVQCAARIEGAGRPWR